MAEREAYYEIRKEKDGDFYFVLIASNGEPVAKSEDYPTKSNARRGIDAVRRAAPTMNVEDATKAPD